METTLEKGIGNQIAISDHNHFFTKIPKNFVISSARCWSPGFFLYYDNFLLNIYQRLKNPKLQKIKIIILTTDGYISEMEKSIYFQGKNDWENSIFFRSRSQKKRLTIRSKSELAFRVERDWQSDQKRIVWSDFDLFRSSSSILWKIELYLGKFFSPRWKITMKWEPKRNDIIDLM